MGEFKTIMIDVENSVYVMRNAVARRREALDGNNLDAAKEAFNEYNRESLNLIIKMEPVLALYEGNGMPFRSNRKSRGWDNKSRLLKYLRSSRDLHLKPELVDVVNLITNEDSVSLID